MFATVLLLFAPAAEAHGQGGTDSTIPPERIQANADALPEAPARASRLARFESLAIGSFPIMLLYTDVGFGIGRYVAHGFDVRYAPWPFGNQYSVPVDSGERGLRIGIAVLASLVLAAIDSISMESRDAKRRSDAELDNR